MNQIESNQLTKVLKLMTKLTKIKGPLGIEQVFDNQMENEKGYESWKLR